MDSSLLMLGAIISQVIQAGMTPVLTRLYSPAAFGEWTLVLSAAGIFGAFAGLRYEPAIVLAATDDEARDVFLLGAVLAVAAGLVAMAALGVGGGALANVMGSKRVTGWLWAVPAVVVLTALGLSTTYWLLRLKRFKVLGFFRAGQATAMTVSQVTLGLVAVGGVGGLMIGSLAGLGFFVLALGVVGGLRLPAPGQQPLATTRMVRVAKKFRKFPLYVVPYSLVSTVRERGIIFLLGIYGGARVIGFFSLGYRALYTTTAAFSVSLGSVLFQRAASQADVSTLAPLANRLIQSLARLGAPILTLVCWASFSGVVPQILGKQWGDAGPYIALLAIPSLTFLMSGVFDRILDTVGRQRLAFLIELTYTVSSLAAIWLVLATASPVAAVEAYAAISGLYHISWIVACYRVCRFPIAGLVSAGTKMILLILVTAAPLMLFSLFMSTTQVAVLGLIGLAAYYGIVGRALMRDMRSVPSGP